MQERMLVPLPWRGAVCHMPWQELDWLKEINDKAYCALWQRWNQPDLPLGHDFYVVSYHLEQIDWPWLYRQATRIPAQILLLSDLNLYDYPLPNNVTYCRYLYWHRQVAKIQAWFPGAPARNLKSKASAICHRITESKLIVFTALAEYLGTDHCRLKLGHWLEEKNVHYQQPTGRKKLDALIDTFWTRYWGKNYTIDTFDSDSDNYQRFTANPWHDFLQTVAVNFTNESWHYSQTNGQTLPGPFLTEKTLRCLVGGTPFVPVGQHNTLGSLQVLGFQFDLGFSTNWDMEHRDNQRLEAIIDIIQSMSTMTAQDIYQAAQHSAEHNHDHVRSGRFYAVCEQLNQHSVQELVTMLK